MHALPPQKKGISFLQHDLEKHMQTASKKELAETEEIINAFSQEFEQAFESLKKLRQNLHRKVEKGKV